MEEATPARSWQTGVDEPERERGPRKGFLGSRAGRVVAGLALIAGFGAGGAGIAWAATGSSSPNSTTATTSPPGTQPPAGRFHGGFGGFGGPGGIGIGGGGVLHGSFVTKNPSGGYQTVDVQQGTASDVSSTSITLKSSDGYSHTYSVDAQTLVDGGRDGIASIANNDQVGVSAVSSNGSDTAKRITDITKIGASMPKPPSSSSQPGQP